MGEYAEGDLRSARHHTKGFSKEMKDSAADGARAMKLVQDLDGAIVADRTARKTATFCMKTVVHRQ